MAPATIHMGYVGGVTIGGTQYFMSGSSLNPNQSVEAPDLVAGSLIKKGWVFGKVDPSGNVSGPLHENATTLWPFAFDRTDELDHLKNYIDIELAFYQGGGWSFSSCVLNSLNITATAGEVVNFTADFKGRSLTTASGTPTSVTCAKLMTWDRCMFGITGLTGTDNLQSINFTINNNVQSLFAIQGSINNVDGLYPVDLPCGMREISGSISAYAEGPITDINTGADYWGGYEAATAQKAIAFAVSPVLDLTFDAVFSRPTGAGQTGATVYTMNFTAVCVPDNATLT